MNGHLAYQNDYFKVEHCDDCGIPGHLIISPHQPVKTLSDLPVDALAIFGQTLALCQSVINTVIQPARIYTLSFCEVLPLLHFHIFPRTEALLLKYNQVHNLDYEHVNGALFFDWARKITPDQDQHYACYKKHINDCFQSIIADQMR